MALIGAGTETRPHEIGVDRRRWADPCVGPDQSPMRGRPYTDLVAADPRVGRSPISA